MWEERMKRVATALVISLIFAILAACSKSSNTADQLGNDEIEIKQQVAQITPELIRHPSPDEVRREEFSSLPPSDYSVTSLSQDQIRKLVSDEKERLVSRYIKEELTPKVEGFTAKWNPILLNFHALAVPEKKAKAAELDRDLASLEKIDNRFQTVMLKTILQKTRALLDKIQLNLANIEVSR
jgi:hypothetical protein